VDVDFVCAPVGREHSHTEGVDAIADRQGGLQRIAARRVEEVIHRRLTAHNPLEKGNVRWACARVTVLLMLFAVT
jgi:hypothetical protein